MFLCVCVCVQCAFKSVETRALLKTKKNGHACLFSVGCLLIYEYVHICFAFFMWRSSLYRGNSITYTKSWICDKSVYPVKRRALHLAQFNFTCVNFSLLVFSRSIFPFHGIFFFGVCFTRMNIFSPICMIYFARCRHL